MPTAPNPLADGLLMPSGFEVSQYDSVIGFVKPYRESQLESWKLFHAAWRGFAYRYKAAGESNMRFSELIKISLAPPVEVRYQQDDALYSFFGSALSSLECFYFSARCLGALSNPTMFGITKAKELIFQPKDVVAAFSKHFPGAELSQTLDGCCSSVEYTKLSNIRNVLSHRGTPPRHQEYGGTPILESHIPGNPKELSSNWQFDWAVGPSTTQETYDWLEVWCCELMSAAEKFCQENLHAAA